MTSSSRLFEDASREIVALHDRFVLWFTVGEGDEGDFSSIEAALDPAFTMIPPNGALTDRNAVLNRIRAMGGVMAGDFRIVIEDIVPVWEGPDTIAVAYVEAQYRLGTWTRRRSSALFVRHPSVPAGVLWRHLHETWMQATDFIQNT